MQSPHRTMLDGVLWTVGLAASNKIITFAGQIILARLLIPDDFGVVALALSMTQAIGLLTLGEAGEVIVQRQGRFDENLSQAFWLAMSTCALSVGLVVAAAPLTAAFFKNPAIVSLVIIDALSWLFEAAIVTFTARMRHELRFRHLAVIHVIMGVVNTLSAVGFAWFGFGPLALILGGVARRVVGVVLLWFVSGGVKLRRPEWGPSVAIALPALWLSAANFVTALQTHGANLVVGRLHNEEQAGLFSWSYAISVQVIYLLSGNLRTVLMPSFVRLKSDPRAQLAALRRTIGILIAISIPVCAVQMVAATYGMHLLFPAKWLPAAGLIAAFSAGLVLEPAYSAATAGLIALGQFRVQSILSLLRAALILGAVLLGGWTGAAAGAALYGAFAWFVSALAVIFIADRLAHAAVKSNMPLSEPLAPLPNVEGLT